MSSKPGKRGKMKALYKQGTNKELFIKKFGKKIDEYESFRRAISGLGSGTAKGYSVSLIKFCLFIGETPDEIIANRQKDLTGVDPFNVERYERHVKSFVKFLEEEDLVVSVHLNRLQGFFKNNSKRFRLEMERLKFSKNRKKKKYSPSQSEVRLLFQNADCARDKLIVALAFQNGIVPSDIANLKVGEYPSVAWCYYSKARKKTGELWHGVSTPDICACLAAYMVIRRGVVGEPLFVGREGVLDGAGVGVVLKGLIERAGLGSIVGFMPKCLRDGFADVLVDADVYLQVKEALMGHGGGNIYHQYGSAKKVEERCIEAMKKAYPLLCLTDNAVSNGNGDVALLLKELMVLLPDMKEVISQAKKNGTIK